MATKAKVTRASGRTKIMWFPKTAAAAIGTNVFVDFASGYITVCASDTGELILGVYRGDSYSTADTYVNLVPVEVPIEKYVEWELDVYDSGCAQSIVGTYVDLHTDGGQLLGSTSTDASLLVTKYISATKARVVIAKGADTISWDT